MNAGTYPDVTHVYALDTEIWRPELFIDNSLSVFCNVMSIENICILKFNPISLEKSKLPLCCMHCVSFVTVLYVCYKH